MTEAGQSGRVWAVHMEVSMPNLIFGLLALVRWYRGLIEGHPLDA